MAGVINFFTEDSAFHLKQKRLTRIWLYTVVDKLTLACGDLNFIFSSDRYLLKINRDYLNHDFYTDIITFDNAATANLVSGDLFISITRVKENAKIHKTQFIDELNRVMVHGVLHLAGYKDKRKLDELKMRKMENKMLSLRTF